MALEVGRHKAEGMLILLRDRLSNKTIRTTRPVKLRESAQPISIQKPAVVPQFIQFLLRVPLIANLASANSCSVVHKTKVRFTLRSNGWYLGKTI